MNGIGLTAYDAYGFIYPGEGTAPAPMTVASAGAGEDTMGAEALQLASAN